jgi:hypothetical protein
MAIAMLIFGTAFAAFCIWLIVRIANMRDRGEFIELVELAWTVAAVFALIVIVGSWSMLGIFMRDD